MSRRRHLRGRLSAPRGPDIVPCPATPRSWACSRRARRLTVWRVASQWAGGDHGGERRRRPRVPVPFRRLLIAPRYTRREAHRSTKEAAMEFHGMNVGTQFKRMRELVPDAYKAFLEFDQKAFKDGAIPGKTKELIALGIAQITQCPWCIQAHTKKAATAGASDAEIAETTFVAMAMAAGAAWSHGGLALQCLQEHKG